MNSHTQDQSIYAVQFDKLINDLCSSIRYSANSLKLSQQEFRFGAKQNETTFKQLACACVSAVLRVELDKYEAHTPRYWELLNILKSENLELFTLSPEKSVSKDLLNFYQHIPFRTRIEAILNAAPPPDLIRSDLPNHIQALLNHEEYFLLAGSVELGILIPKIKQSETPVWIKTHLISIGREQVLSPILTFTGSWEELEAVVTGQK